MSKKYKSSLEIRQEHPLHSSKFDYDKPQDLIKNFGNPNFELRNLLKNFSIEKPAKSRYTLPTMPQTHTVEQLQSRKKLHTLNHNSNSNKTRASRLLRIATNKNLHHKNTYSAVNSKNQNFNRINNSLIFKGQALNSPLVQRLHSSNGGNLREENGTNYVIDHDINVPLTGIVKKYHHHSTSLPNGKVNYRLGSIVSII